MTTQTPATAEIWNVTPEPGQVFHMFLTPDPGPIFLTPDPESCRSRLRNRVHFWFLMFDHVLKISDTPGSTMSFLTEIEKMDRMLHELPPQPNTNRGQLRTRTVISNIPCPAVSINVMADDVSSVSLTPVKSLN